MKLAIYNCEPNTLKYWLIINMKEVLNIGDLLNNIGKMREMFYS